MMSCDSFKVRYETPTDKTFIPDCFRRLVSGMLFSFPIISAAAAKESPYKKSGSLFANP